MPEVGYRVKETTTTTGLGTYSLGGTSFGFQTFVAGIGDGVEAYYVCEDIDLVGGTGDWEVGRGLITDASPDTLSRLEIFDSSNGGAAVDWGAGTRNIFSSHPAAAFMVGSNNLSELTNLSTARSNLGLGSAALSAVGDFEPAGGNIDQAGHGFSVGDLVFCQSSPAGVWILSDADNARPAEGMVNQVISSQFFTIRVAGLVDWTSGLTVGAQYWTGITPGAGQSTDPSFADGDAISQRAFKVISTTQVRVNLQDPRT